MAEKDLLSKWLLGIAAGATLAAGGAALTTWAKAQTLESQVQDLKSQLSAGVSSATVAKVEGKCDALEQRLADWSSRVESLERAQRWDRNRHRDETQ